ncbi:MAG: phospholipid/cholesterol/gamma-HCH transport system permease protein [Myxococcota bacterium]|jgi:phospholipid/cholesterol/gamma-HCH transport system permease protein
MDLVTLEEAEVPEGRLLTLRGQLDRDGVPLVQKRLMGLARERGPDLIFDLSDVNRVDTAGVAFFSVLERLCVQSDKSIQVREFSDSARHAFQLIGRDDDLVIDRPRRMGFFERIGSAGIARWQAMVAFLMMAADAFVWSFGGARQTAKVRRGAVTLEAVRIGLNALPIVALISLLIGLVLALQSASQLRAYGADVLMAQLITGALTKEMGPLITAIIVAGRSGAAIAAEVATMQVSEEIAALRVMGLSPVRYIVVPKLKAITLTMPALTTFANVLGIIGGFIVALTYMKLSATVYFTNVWDALLLRDVLIGLLKSLAFAWIIVLIGAHKGFQAHGGAESVGQVTTESVVSGIFWVIVADAMFSLVFYFGG